MSVEIDSAPESEPAAAAASARAQRLRIVLPIAGVMAVASIVWGAATTHSRVEGAERDLKQHHEWIKEQTARIERLEGALSEIRISARGTETSVRNIEITLGDLRAELRREPYRAARDP